MRTININVVQAGLFLQNLSYEGFKTTSKFTMYSISSAVDR